MRRARSFHVTNGSIFAGDVIEPGRHSAQYRQFRPGGPMPTPQSISNLLWELALEAARVAATPEKPSRFDSVFAWETLEDARWFRDHYRSEFGSILEVEFEADIPLHRGSFDLITAKHDTAYVDFMGVGAGRYWIEPPTGRVELLIGGPITVMGALH